MSEQGAWDDFDVIHVYTREQAIDDGMLVDVSYLARQVGVHFPTTVTQTVWASYVAVPEGVVGQDEQGRLWDILWMFRMAVGKDGNGDTDQFRFSLLVRNDNLEATEVSLKAICGPGDKGEPVVTIMLPEED